LKHTLLIAIGTALLARLLLFFMPWWSVCVAAFVVSLLIAQNGRQAVFGSSIGVFVLWMVMALIIDIRNASVLSVRVADIFFVHRPVFLIIITGLIGGLSVVLPGLAGYYMRRILNMR